jgi:AraC family transcriptional regulator
MLPQFPGSPSSLSSATRHSAITMARITVDIAAGDLFEARMAAEDAHVVLLQLRDHPPHHMRLNGRLRELPASPRSTLNIVDLKAEPLGLLRHPVDTLFFHIPQIALDDIAEDAGATRIDRLTAPGPISDSILRRMESLFVEALDQGDQADRLLYDNLLLGIAGHFASAYGGMRPRTLAMRGGLATWQARRAKDLLSSDLTTEVTLQDIASECSLSLGYFARAFKRTTGSSPYAWRQARRIDNAKDLLKHSSISLAEIAIICGFSDQSHFNRVFAQQTGTTPGLWRKSLIGIE